MLNRACHCDLFLFSPFCRGGWVGEICARASSAITNIQRPVQVFIILSLKEQGDFAGI